MAIHHTTKNHKPIAGAICLTALLLLSQVVCAYHFTEHTELVISEETTCELCLYASHSAAHTHSHLEFTPPKTLSGSCLYINYCPITNPSELAAIRAPPNQFSF